jgi:plasmid stabilization system protein ParE
LAEVNWTRESEIWLKDIYDYIAADDAEAAARTIVSIYEKAQLLRNHPQLGHRYKEYEAEESREIRILLYRITA